MKIHLLDGALYSVCKDLDVSRDELARRMGVATATAFRVDKGDVDPSPRFIASLMHLTGKRFEELFVIVGEDAA